MTAPHMSALAMENNTWVVFVLIPVSRWHKFLLLLMLLTLCSAQSTYYVKPTPDTPCPGKPCRTLSQYVADQYFKNLPVNTTMEFLPGSHTLEKTISIKTLTWLTLHGDSSFSPEGTSSIVCTWPAGFVFTGITELHISALAFFACGHNDSAAINIIFVQWSNISNCSFYNNTGSYECDYCDYGSGHYYGGALNIQVSNVILIGNVFQNNFAGFIGGVLHVEDSILTITDNTFQNNSASYLGGVLYVE